MAVSVRPCPVCGVKLRLRVRELAGQSILCPDCQAPLQVLSERSAAGAEPEVQLVATQLISGAAQRPTSAAQGPVVPQVGSAKPTRGGNSTKSPQPGQLQSPANTGPATAPKPSTGRSLASQEGLSAATGSPLADAPKRLLADPARAASPASALPAGTVASIGLAVASPQASAMFRWWMPSVAVLVFTAALVTPWLIGWQFGSPQPPADAMAAGLAVNNVAELPPSQSPPEEPAALVVADKPLPPPADAAPAASSVGDVPAPEPSSGAEQGPWSALWRPVQGFRDEHRAFPRGAFGPAAIGRGSRFSWQAQLLDYTAPDERIRADFQRSWSDPVNERFVRRRVAMFLNPAIHKLVGEDGLPTTHYVGVAGVGDDAAELPIDHPRAGVFGWDRVTRPTDIRDGASQTLLLLPVMGGFSSWAAAGHGTVRGVTEPPYLAGRDQFGDGQRDRMTVLMADGSVREISSEIAPVVFRRMAAMSDGLSLDPRSSGDPRLIPYRPRGDAVAAGPDGSNSNTQQTPESTLPGDPSVVDPLSPPGRPDVPAAADDAAAAAAKPVDIEAALGLRIRQFKLDQPVAVQELVWQFEELLGVPIAADATQLGPDIERLKRRVTVQLRDTTLRGVMEKVLGEIGLGFRVAGGRLELIPVDRDSDFER